MWVTVCSWTTIANLNLVLLLGVSSSSIWEPGFRSRIKGQVACYSCLATSSSTNMSLLAAVFEQGGMNVPILAGNCADSLLASSPNLAGANVHFCPNTLDEPGACVKLRGLYQGRVFVYRECWTRMWLEPRPYQGRLSDRCYNDAGVQSFVSTTKNTICFCEDDLCNNSSNLSPAFAFTALIVLLAVFK